MRLIQKDEQGNWCVKGLEWEQLHVGQVITQNVWEKLYGALWKLMEYEDTGLTPEDINNLIDLLQGKCWACENGKPYKVGSKHLTTCEHLNCVAATSNVNCPFWKLKQFDSSQN